MVTLLALQHEVRVKFNDDSLFCVFLDYGFLNGQVRETTQSRWLTTQARLDFPRVVHYCIVCLIEGPDRTLKPRLSVTTRSLRNCRICA